VKGRLQLSHFRYAELRHFVLCLKNEFFGKDATENKTGKLSVDHVLFLFIGLNFFPKQNASLLYSTSFME
jgi:hypothetical protein